MVAAKMDTRDNFTEFDDRTVPKKKAAGGGVLSPLNAHFHLKSDITELILVYIYIYILYECNNP